MDEAKKYFIWQEFVRNNKTAKLILQILAVYSPLIVLVLMIIVFVVQKNNAVIWDSLVALILSRGLVVPIFVYFFPTPRPYVKYNFNLLSRSHFFYWGKQGMNSFPSGHTASIAAIGTSFIYFTPVIGTVLVVLAVLAGFARVVLGYHFTRDIVAGFVIGILCGFLAHLVLYS